MVLIQPDNSELHCFTSGDEYYARLHDQNDYTIIQSNVDGYYYYAELIGSNIIPSIYKANQQKKIWFGCVRTVISKKVI